jgi:hypothetical protein
MAWTKQNLKWNAVNVAKVNGAAKATLTEATKALILSDEKVKAARTALLPFFDGKMFPKCPDGKIIRLSVKLDRNNEISVKAAAADVSDNNASDEFAW